MQRIKLAELASRQAELASEDDVSTSSTSSSEHDRTLSKSVSASTPNPESSEEMDGDDGTLLDLNAPQTAGSREDELRERIGAAQERMHSLIQSFDEDQLQRYETFRRIGIPRPAVKRLIQRVTEHTNVNANCVIITSGIAKIFVGELIEGAVEVAEEWSQGGVDPEWVEGDPLRPSHLLEAHRRLQARNPSCRSA